jgi:AcrR family transcriptional regulator
VAAATDLVLERGAAATSLDEVMAASRTSRSQLYHYFVDKADLLRAVMQQQTEQIARACRAGCCSPRSTGPAGPWPVPSDMAIDHVRSLSIEGHA